MWGRAYWLSGAFLIAAGRIQCKVDFCAFKVSPHHLNRDFVAELIGHAAFLAHNRLPVHVEVEVITSQLRDVNQPLNKHVVQQHKHAKAGDGVNFAREHFAHTVTHKEALEPCFDFAGGFVCTAFGHGALRAQRDPIPRSLAADGRAGMAMVATQIAAGMAALTWIFAEWMAKGKPSVLGIASGAVAGLVAITPAAGFVDPKGALAIGAIAGVGCYWGATGLKHMLGYDDSLDAFGVHGVGGIIGAILTGVFAVKEIGAVDGSVMTQLLGVGATVAYSLVMTFVILKVIDLAMGLRVAEEQEREGLDVTLHGERVE